MASGWLTSNHCTRVRHDGLSPVAQRRRLNACHRHGVKPTSRWPGQPAAAAHPGGKADRQFLGGMQELIAIAARRACAHDGHTFLIRRRAQNQEIVDHAIWGKSVTFPPAAQPGPFQKDITWLGSGSARYFDYSEHHGRQPLTVNCGAAPTSLRRGRRHDDVLSFSNQRWPSFKAVGWTQKVRNDHRRQQTDDCLR